MRSQSWSPATPVELGDPESEPWNASRCASDANRTQERGEVAERPEFPILFRRLRDRISTLRALYGAGPWKSISREWASAPRPVAGRCDLPWEQVHRKSRTHWPGSPHRRLHGRAEYEGELGEFLPWLHAARWVGVGRQTVWGKGDVRVL